MPFTIEVEHYIQCADMHAIEEYWHHLFRAKRLEGEWFNLSEDDIALFRSKNTMNLTAYMVANIILRREVEEMHSAFIKSLEEREEKNPEAKALREEYGDGPFVSFMREHLTSALEASEHLKEL